jgi:TolB protein
VAVAVGAAPSAAAATSERIVFVSDRDGNWELYAMNADGSSPTRLTFDPHDDLAPTTPASGARIAFARGRFTADPPPVREDDWFDIYVMDTDGSNVKRLTRDEAADGSPSFSPDGSKIAFSSYRDQNSDIYVMNADGSALTRLTQHPDNDDFPAWSPDGSKIAFSSNRGASSSDIYVMNADGSAPARLTTSETSEDRGDVSPAWSPDGRRIVFHRQRTTAGFLVDESEIFVINADGSGEMQLTDTPPRPTGIAWDLSSSYPSWSPDGTRIAFGRDDAAQGQEIYVMNADGSDPRALTSNTAGDSDPAFAPVPIAGPGSAPLTGTTRLSPSRVTIAGRGRCRRRSRRILRCAVRLRGRVVRPAGPRASCAGGRVTATLRFRRRRVASVRTRTTRGCRYRVRTRFGLRTERRVRRLSVAPRFGGSDFFSPRAGRRQKIRVRLAEG